MGNGYTGNILRIDLGNERTSIENPDDIFYRRYIGGEGIVAYYLLKELKAGIDPLGPENKLIFAAGPLTGLTIPGTGRNSVGAKSPLTGGFGEAEVGGYWGAELKHTGYDAIIIEGKAKNPVYLWINNGEIEIKDAGHLWGKITGDTQKIIQDELNNKNIRIAQIGPGGEKLVRYACIINELRDAAGRTGMGCVMGSKNLKAIAVKGNKKPEAKDKEKLRELIKMYNEVYQETIAGYFEFGTGGDYMERSASSGNLPFRNFRDGGFTNAKALDPINIKETFGMEKDGCYACSIRCKKIIKIENPWTIDSIYGGPEYETLGALGSTCGIDDVATVCKGNELCNKYSLDTISTGVSIGFAMECYENGILSDKDTDGIKLNFGNSEAMIQMIEKIAHRQGLGDILAEGVKKAAEKIKNGSNKYAMHVKGVEIPMHEPRLKQGLGIGYALSPTGAEHMTNLHDDSISHSRVMARHGPIGILEPLEMNDLSPKKVRAVLYHTNWQYLSNALLMCYFLSWSYHHLTEVVQAVTGWNTSIWELMKAGERISTMARVYNTREGLTENDDWLPERFFEPHTSGALSEVSIDPEKLKSAIKTYYKMMGWNENGIPTKAKLEELEIDWII
ncbi:MAG: aldehyde ferredoxin oxidoreductase family protein [Candidatus Hodarchaeota archaeon]